MLNFTHLEGIVSSLKIELKDNESVLKFDLMHQPPQGEPVAFPVAFFGRNAEKYKRTVLPGALVIVTGHARIKTFGVYRDLTIIGTSVEVRK